MPEFSHPCELPSDDRVMTVSDVLRTLQVSRSWLYSDAGRAVVGPGFNLGRSRRYRQSAILAALARCEGTSQ